MSRVNGARAALIGGVSVLSLTTAVMAADAAPYEIDAGALNKALTVYIDQSGEQLVYRADDVKTATTKGVDGDYESKEALDKLLDGTGFSAKWDESGAAIIVKASASRDAADRGTRYAMLSQSTASDAVQEPSFGIDTITVTAQKRAQNLQDVPVSVGAATGEALERANANNVEDIANIVAGVDIRGTSNGVRNSSIRVRGIGTSVFVSGVEPSASLVIDGVVQPRPGLLNSSMFDIERVEVLRGPQGTLFGKNASAGAISVVSRRPTDEFEGYLRGLIAEDGEYKINGAISGPVSENVNMRLAAQYRNIDGFVENVNRDGGPDLGGADGIAGRLSIEWTPTDAFDLLFIAEGETKDSTCCAAVLREATHSSVVTTAAPVGIENQYTNTTADVFDNVDTWAATIQANWDLGGPTLHYVGGYRDWRSDQNNDRDLIGVDLVPVEGGIEDVRSTHHELRFDSEVGKFYDYTVGLFYYYGDAFRSFDQIGCRANNATVSPDGSFTCSVTPDRHTQADSTITSENYAVFGQVNIHPTERLTVLGGFRYLQENLETDFIRISPSPRGAFNGRQDVTFVDETDDDALIGKVGAQYDLTDQIMAYFTYARGYKGKAYFNGAGVRRNLLESGLYPLNPEKSEVYELGIRSEFFDRRLVLNVTGYLSEFKDFQANVRDPISNVNTVLNAGVVTADGIEVEFDAAPFEGMTISGGFSYLDGKYGEFLNVPCYRGQRGVDPACDVDTNLQDLRGAPLQNAPEFSFNIRGLYEFNIGEWNSYGLVAYRWRDEAVHAVNQDPKTIHEAYGVLDLTVGLSSPDGRYEFSVFGKNMFDNHYATLIYGRPGNVGGGIAQVLPRDVSRYFGASLGVNF